VADSFPRQKARTRNFTLGAPRSFQFSEDGRRLVFLRSPGGADPDTGLWVYDVEARQERLVVDPRELISRATPETLSPEEQARRERARETAGGIVAYAIDRFARQAALVQAGRLFIADLESGGARELAVPTPVFDPRPDPTGRRVAFVHDRGLYVVDVRDGSVTRLAGEDDPAVSWGLAEFVAAEEMERIRGYWWSPDGEAILASRVDESAVEELWIAAPVDPAAPARSLRYPRAGTANARVEAHLVRLEPHQSTRVVWDEAAFPYLASAHWDQHGPMLVVQSRDQRSVRTLAVDPQTGRSTALAEQTDPDWIDLIPGLPRRLEDGRPVTLGAAGDASALLIDGQPVTAEDLEVKQVVGVDGQRVLLRAASRH